MLNFVAKVWKFFEIIKEMWNKLGVTKGYQENFINFINSLDNIDNMKVYLNTKFFD